MQEIKKDAYVEVDKNMVVESSIREPDLTF